MLSLNEVINVGVTLIALPVSMGPLFGLLIQGRWDTNNKLLAGLCLSCGLWALLPLFYVVTTWNTITFLRLIVMVMMLVAGAFFLFTADLLEAHDQATKLLRSMLPVAAIVTVILAGIAEVAQPSADDLRPLPLAYALLAVTLFYMGTSTWMTLSSADSSALALRIPIGLSLVGHLLVWPLYQANLILSPLLVAAAILLISWKELRGQFLTLVNGLRDELRTATRDLQQVANSLAEEKKKVENLRQDVQAANQYKSDFVSNMSHELRTPLNSIIGYSELLRNGIYGELNEKQKDRLEKIQRNGGRLLDLISDILDLNRIDAGKFDLDLQAVEVQPLVEQAITEIQPQCNEKALTLSSKFESDLPDLIVDKGRLNQVLSNLLDNAVKFTHEGEIQIHVRSVKVADGSAPDFALPTLGWLRDGVWVVISVTDSGIGIAPEDQARVFEEFSQVEIGTTREFSGTGLGLAISKRLVEMHRGVMWVKSTLEHGSTFFVALPTGSSLNVNKLSQARITDKGRG